MNDDKRLVAAQQRAALMAALLDATAPLSQNENPLSVVRAFCDALVAASPHIRLAWAYLGEPNAEYIRPTYISGPAAAYAEQLEIGRDEISLRGPARQTLRTAKAIVVKTASDSSFMPWREQALNYNLEAMFCVALRCPVKSIAGLVSVAADTADYFDQIGLAPFLAFGRLAEVALMQAAARQRLEELATYDHLTGLFNRRAFEVHLEQTHKSALQQKQKYSILLFDIDHFKLVNDTYGHETGDRVLKHISAIAQDMLRQSDILARWGGEEFICLLPNTNDQAAWLIAERLRTQISGLEYPLDKHCILCTISCGIATFPLDGHDMHTLLASADASLYEAKRGGRNRIRQCKTEGRGVLATAGQIEQALQDKRIIPAYQPIIDLRSRQFAGEEILARMRMPDGQTLEAAIFIEAASQLQIIHRIDHAIIRQALLRCRLHRHADKVPLHFVNISGDLLRHPALVDDLLAQATQECRGVRTDSQGQKPIIIEITERELLSDTQDALQILKPFLDFGMRLAIDDFGSGFSSFKYLADLPIAFLKIEGDLIQRLHEPKVRAIIEGIQEIARKLDVTTIAEHVENEETAQHLLEIGIDWAQGYYFGAPQL